ncbi:MAG: UDP-N-acetylglucosamine 2-epimerase (non-hydrolyzing) [Thermodesulfobacteriota bacterium]|nr:UDP-N-acetylglucosamine 2-epimerase (non-hydrolyzing) [Thermodesulfobacteriota bacterium]
MKVVSLVGARPQFVKEAVVGKALDAKGIDEVLVHSGQHFDVNMSDVFFQTLHIRQPGFNLHVGSGTHGEMTGKIMVGFEKLLLDIKPDIVLVYGDTNTTLAGALVAAKLKIDTAHIEAGIRMQPKKMPEEINRVVVDSVADILFCPSKHAVNNLRKEGRIDNVHFTGDVMYDLFLMMKERFTFDVFNRLDLKKGQYVLLTLHRDYNVDDPDKLQKILEKLHRVSSDIQVVFPMHPRTRKRISEFQLEQYLKKLTIIEPCDYLNMMGLLTASWKVITDSGGLQKEAYFAGKECLVLMPDTGWVELVENKCSFLCNENNLELLVTKRSLRQHARLPDIYGKGDAARLIAETLMSL